MTLAKQNATLTDVQEKAGVVVPPIPDTGWLYVGRLAEDKRFAPGPSISPSETRLDGERVVGLQIRTDTPVTENGDECIRKKLEDIHPPTAEQLQSVQVLLSPSPKHLLDVVATATCPSIGNGKWVYAKVRISKEDVKFAKFDTLIRR